MPLSIIIKIIINNYTLFLIIKKFFKLLCSCINYYILLCIIIYNNYEKYIYIYDSLIMFLLTAFLKKNMIKKKISLRSKQMLAVHIAIINPIIHYD